MPRARRRKPHDPAGAREAVNARRGWSSVKKAVTAPKEAEGERAAA